MVTCLLQTNETKKLNIVHESVESLRIVFNIYKFAQKSSEHFWQDYLSCNTNLYQSKCSEGLFNTFPLK